MVSTDYAILSNISRHGLHYHFCKSLAMISAKFIKNLKCSIIMVLINTHKIVDLNCRNYAVSENFDIFRRKAIGNVKQVSLLLIRNIVIVKTTTNLASIRFQIIIFSHYMSNNFLEFEALTVHGIFL